MAISKKDVERIAKLARLGLSEKEKEKLAQELSGILDYMDKLNEVDPIRGREGSSRTKQDVEHVRGFVRDPQRASASNGVDTENVEPTAQVTGLTNIFRKDENPHEVDVEKVKKIIGQAPQREGNFVKTKPILEK